MLKPKLHSIAFLSQAYDYSGLSPGGRSQDPRARLHNTYGGQLGALAPGLIAARGLQPPVRPELVGICLPQPCCWIVAVVCYLRISRTDNDNNDNDNEEGRVL